MNVNELSEYIRNKYNILLPNNYLHFALTFNHLDKDCKDLQTHHICPKCCGGKNEEQNLVRITFHHHRKLHQLILQTKELTDEQRYYLSYAYNKMKKG